MAGKPLTQANAALAYAIDGLTKNQLADIVIDLARKQIGHEDATDLDVMEMIQGWWNPIAHARLDKLTCLEHRYNQFVKAGFKQILDKTREAM